MSENKNIKTEQEFISLLIRNSSLASEWSESGPEIKYFDESHQILLHAIKSYANQGTTLTKKALKQFLTANGKNKIESSSIEAKYDKIDILYVKEDDYEVLKKDIINFYTDKQIINGVNLWKQHKDDGRDSVFAMKKLKSILDDLAEKSSLSRPITYKSVADHVDIFLEEIEDIRSGKKEEGCAIKTGIKEIDDSICIGLAPGTLTIIAAPPGNFKTSQMLNIASNVWDAGYNVLFVPIEMSHKMLYKKLTSRLTHIPFDHIELPSTLMSDEEYKSLKEKMKIIQSKKEKNNIVIMENPNGTTIASITREIERHIEIFKPQLVIIDYVEIVKPDESMKNERDDIKIGMILKSMRDSGKPGFLTKEGYGVISGAQIGKEAMKRIKKLGATKATFDIDDLRGSHCYGMDSDNIFAQMKDPAQPNSRINLFHLKTRYGKPQFSNGESKCQLEVIPNISLIRDINNAASWGASSKSDILKKMDDNFLSSDEINFEEKPKPKENKDLKPKNQSFDILDDFDLDGI